MDWRDVWRRLFPSRMIESDVRTEVSFHIEERVRELVAAGWDEEDARRETLERFGDVESVEAMCRVYDAQRLNGDSWRMGMEAWVRDFRFALRGLRKNSGYSLVVIATLALGIGATTAVFSVVEGILLRPLPFPEADRLAVVWQNDRATDTERENASPADFYDYVERSRTFDGFAMTATGTAVLERDGGPPVQLGVASVSRSLWDVLGISMQLGRAFSEEEAAQGGPATVVLTDAAWRELFAADPGIIGAAVVLDEVSREVVGVLPPGVEYPRNDTYVWLPIDVSPTTATRQNHWVRVLGRLGDSASMEGAQAEMSAIMADLEAEYPTINHNRGAFVEPLASVGRGDLGTTLWVLFGAVLVVLLIACVNVANLMLARGATRTAELALLGAIGASRTQILRRFFAEAAAMTAMAAVVGVALAAVGVEVLTAIAPASLTALGRPSVNGPVLLFALTTTGVICLGFGVLPSIQALRIDLQSHLKEGRASDASGAGLSFRRFLVSAQLSLAVVLLLGATFLISTLRNLQSVDPGFDAHNALRVDFVLPEARYPEMSTYPNWPEIHGFLRSLEAQAGSVSGVESAAVLLNHPLERGFTNSFRIEGQAYDPTQGEITTRLVTPAYFETAGVSLLRGRVFANSDDVDAPGVVVLNEAAAARYFPDGDALGSRIAFWGPGFREIVGIVENERMHGLAVEAPPAMYVTMYQAPPRGGSLTLMVRTAVPPLAVVDPIREAVRSVDSAVPVFDVATMEATLSEAMARERFASTVLAIFAAVAVLLAVLGVHGVLAYLVSQRGREVGIRMTLGATKGDVVGLVVRQGVWMTVIGIALGTLAALALSRTLRTLLFEVDATAPGAYVAVGLTMAAAALAATVLPARRAASIDPARSLRGD